MVSALPDSGLPTLHSSPGQSTSLHCAQMYKWIIANLMLDGGGGGGVILDLHAIQGEIETLLMTLVNTNRNWDRLLPYVWPLGLNANLTMGSRDVTVVRALASHQCGPGSIHGPIL